VGRDNSVAYEYPTDFREPMKSLPVGEHQVNWHITPRGERPNIIPTETGGWITVKKKRLWRRQTVTVRDAW
jgi:hypothetical protein